AGSSRGSGPAAKPAPHTRGSSDPMTAVLEGKDVYLAHFADFEKALGEGRRSPLHRLRQAAVERFAALGFPTTEDEEWRFTSVAPLTRVPFKPAGGREAVRPEQLDRAAFHTGAGRRLGFVTGRYARELPPPGGLPDGAIPGSRAEAPRPPPDKVEPPLARHADYDDQAFTALNTAFLRDGAFLFLPRNKVVEEPVHLVF